MAAVRQVSDLRVLVDGWRGAGERVGVVPTMGALHAGHLALIAAAKADCARVIATLFVNPQQFNRSDDLASYPRDRSEEHTSELQSLMHISYTVFCLNNI